MAYKRKRRTFKRRKGISRKVVRKIAKSVVSRSAEKKFADASGNSGIDFNGTNWQIATPIQGITLNTRIGDSFNWARLEIRGSITAAATTNVVRVMVYSWKPDNYLDAPNIDDLFPKRGTALAPYSPTPTPDTRAKMVVHFERTFAVSASGPEVKTFSKNIYLRSKFHASSVNSTYGRNCLYIVAISDDGAAVYPNMAWFARAHYTDE